MLQAGDQRHMLHRLVWPERIEQVLHHRAVDADVFEFSRLARPGAEEDMARLQVAHGGGKTFGIEQVGCNRAQAGNVACRIAGEACDLETLVDEMAGEVIANNAGGANDEG